MAHHAYGHPYDPNCSHCTPALIDSGQLMEYGPLRHVRPDFQVWPSWMYLDHGPIPCVTRSDHRAEDGIIVPLGRPCLASRQGYVLTLALEDGRRVLLDGSAWVIDGAPILDPKGCPELLLCA